VVVEVGFTAVDPMRVEVEKLPGVMATELAFVMFQLKVEVPAEATTPGETVKEEMMGGEEDPLNAPISQAPEERRAVPTASLSRVGIPAPVKFIPAPIRGDVACSCSVVEDKKSGFVFKPCAS
jgi:hypothetical protein